MSSINSRSDGLRDRVKWLTATRDFWGARFEQTHGGELIALWASAVVVLLVAVVVLSRAEAATEYEYVVACYGEIRPSTPTLSYCTNRWEGSVAAASFDTLFGWLGASVVGSTLLLLVITSFWEPRRKDIEDQPEPDPESEIPAGVAGGSGNGEASASVAPEPTVDEPDPDLTFLDDDWVWEGWDGPVT